MAASMNGDGALFIFSLMVVLFMGYLWLRRKQDRNAGRKWPTTGGFVTSTKLEIQDRGEQSVHLATVSYVDSATIGCLMDLYRQASAVGGALELAGVQKRVETMLTMTGAQNFIEVHADESTAVKSFGA